MRGKTLTQMAQELEYIANNSQDLMVSPKIIQMDSAARLVVGRVDEKVIEPTSWAHQQISAYTEIPKTYYDRMFNLDKNLLKENVNTWLGMQDSDERRLLRTVGGKLRGFLSSRYRVIDSYDLLNVVFPILKEKGFHVGECELTEKRIYIKALLPKMSAEVKKGDIVQFGVLITNSEVGAGMFRIEPFALRLACTNGLISSAAIKKYHVGKNQATDDEMSILSDEALQADDTALMLKIRDTLIASADPQNMFYKQLELMKESVERKIENFDLIEVVKKATTKVGITSKLIRENIVAQLANGNQGAGLTQWGLVNSFTASAKLENIGYDESIDLERAGGQILALNQSEWNTIAV